MIEYWGIFIKGISITIISWLTTSLISLLLGSLFGILSCNYLQYYKTRSLIKFFTFIAKGIPAYVLILISYFIVPSILNLNIPAFVCACCALAFSSSGYVIEIIRSGINSVSIGQWQACTALGYPLISTLKRIILPQTFKNIGPALFGELEQLLKSTSLFATIGITELTRTGMNIISRELNPIPVYMTMACIYLIFSAILNLTSFYIEKRLYYGQH